MRRHAVRLLQCAEAAVTLVGAKAGWVRPAVTSPVGAGAIRIDTRYSGQRRVATADKGSEGRGQVTDAESDAAVLALRWAAITDMVARRLFRKDACLVRAAALQRLLLRRHVPTELRIGVRKQEDGSIASHAWLEHRDRVIMGRLPDLDTYHPLS